VFPSRAYVDPAEPDDELAVPEPEEPEEPADVEPDDEPALPDPDEPVPDVPVDPEPLPLRSALLDDPEPLDIVALARM
jgi:hypothetical protein